MANIIQFNYNNSDSLAIINGYLASEKYVQAIKLSRKCQESITTSPYNYLLSIAKAMIGLQEYKCAIDYLQQSLLLEPSSVECVYLLAKYLNLVGERLASKEYYYMLYKAENSDKYIEELHSIYDDYLNEDHNQPIFNLVDKKLTKSKVFEKCNQLIMKDEIGKALPILINYNEKYPDEIDVLNIIMDIYHDSMDFDKSIEYANKILAMDSSYILAYQTLLSSYYFGKQKKKIPKLIKDVLTIDIKDFTQFVNVCEIIEKGSSYKELLKYMDSYERQFGNRLQYYIMKSIVYHNLGDLGTAVNLIDLSKEIYGELPVIKYHLLYYTTYYFTYNDQFLFATSQDIVPKNLMDYFTGKVLECFGEDNFFNAYRRKLRGFSTVESLEILCYMNNPQLINLYFYTRQRLSWQDKASFVELVSSLPSELNLVKSTIIFNMVDRFNSSEFQLLCNYKQYSSSIEPISDLGKFPPVYAKAYNYCYSIALFNHKLFEIDLYEIMIIILEIMKSDKYSFENYETLAGAIYRLASFTFDEDFDSQSQDLFAKDSDEIMEYVDIIKSRDVKELLESETSLLDQLDVIIRRFEDNYLNE